MKKTWSPSGKLALIFLVFGICWILLTNSLFLTVARNDLQQYYFIQNIKGILFVILSAGLIYWTGYRFYGKTRKALLQLEEALDRYNVLGRATNDGVRDLNLQTGDLYVNPAMGELFGYDEEEMKENHAWWAENLHEEDKENVLKDMRATLEDKKTLWQQEYRFRCKDGRYKVVLDRSFIMYDDTGEPYRLIGALQDVTMQRQLQESLMTTRLQHKSELAQAIVHAEEEERKRVGEELHDNINQLLGVVKLYIDHMRVESTLKNELLEKCGDYLTQVIDEIRNLSKNMMPPGLKEVGLLESIRDQIIGIEMAKNIQIDLKVTGIDEDEISDTHKLMLYRIIQEQLNNIVRHSEATEAAISILHRNGAIRLHIADNGVGFDMSKDRVGIGLNNIRNRLEAFNGTMKVVSSPGNGFRLEIRFDA